MNDSATLAPLFERVRMFLADSDFPKAMEYCERILDIEPTNWEAYYLKFIAALQLPSDELLSQVNYPFLEIPAYRKVLQYAPKEVVDRLTAIDQSNYQRNLQWQYDAALKLKREATKSSHFRNAASAFAQLGGYGDAAKEAAWCVAEAERLAAIEKKQLVRIVSVSVVAALLVFAMILTPILIYRHSPQGNLDYSGTTPSDTQYSETEGGVTIDRLKNKSITSLKIPETIDGKPVVAIADNAFANCEKLEKVTLPSTLVRIGDKAFQNCKNLKEIEFAKDSSLTTIESEAFSGCESLQSVQLPDSVTTLGKEVFYRAHCLATVTLSPNLTTIPEGAFLECRSLGSITIPKSVTEIGSSAFKNCIQLTEAVLTFGLESIGDHAFDGCQSLVKIVIPLTVTHVKEYAFLGCASLTIHCARTTYTYTFDARWNNLTTDGKEIPTYYGSRG